MYRIGRILPLQDLPVFFVVKDGRHGDLQVGFLQGDERQQPGVKEEVELQEPEGTLDNFG